MLEKTQLFQLVGMLKRIEKKIDLLSAKFDGKGCNFDEKYSLHKTKVINNRPCHYILGLGWVDDETGFRV